MPELSISDIFNISSTLHFSKKYSPHVNATFGIIINIIIAIIIGIIILPFYNIVCVKFNVFEFNTTLLKRETVIAFHSTHFKHADVTDTTEILVLISLFSKYH